MNFQWILSRNVHNNTVISEPVVLESTFWQKHGLGVLASKHYSMQAGRLAQSVTRHPISVTLGELPGSTAYLNTSHTFTRQD